MTDWSSLRHAYGPAQDLPDLLAAAERSGSDSAPEWNELWSCLCHQGTVYPASYAVLPILADMAERVAHGAPVQLAAAIVASDDGPAGPGVTRREYADPISRLRLVALRRLRGARDGADFVYGLQALMAFEDGGVWQRDLELLVDGEVPLTCPACGAPSTFDPGGPDHVLVDSDDAEAAPTPVHRVEPVDGTVGARLVTLSREAGRTELAATLCHLLGSGTCPRCASPFVLADALT